MLGFGRNQRVQRGSNVFHGETAALEACGRLPRNTLSSATMYTTLSPCSMCTGAILLYGIRTVVIGENETFVGDEELLRARGVTVINLHNEECRSMMQQFIATAPELWNEDIGK